MSRRDLAEALSRELEPTNSRDLQHNLRRYVRAWEDDGNPHWVDLAVVAVAEAEHDISPALLKILAQVARTRLDSPESGYDGYLVHLAERALDQEPPERGPIDAVWRAAADGRLSDADAAQWVSIIAKRVVEMVIKHDGPTKSRAIAAINALGLRGRIDELYDERRALGLALEFLPLAVASKHPVSWPVKLYRAMRSYYVGVPIRDAKKRLANLEQSLKKKSR